MDGAVVRIHAGEPDIFAEVIATIHAKEAFAAGDTRLHRNAIA